ncbi:autophagy-related protein 2 homolog B isoform X1 [Parasteatoda tepidariorum]|uniref:autophagy-related protein 2 homolog B isoform X2 n=1 Tax=Parasteatoda tepidariorum TaxID=114398 RepID=UPI001C719EB9|nr:autophagy-related protein 2 homolog B isoform X1 [Parasteatoda tepidariorum]
MKFEMMKILDSLSKRVLRVIIKKYFGEYFEDFSQHDLNIRFLEGKGSLENVRLIVQALNELSAEYNLPFEFLQGTIDLIEIDLPTRLKFLALNTIIDIKGLKLVVQPKERPEDVSMFDSIWGSMTSSLQLAEECLNYKGDDDFDNSDWSDGIEKIAETIDAGDYDDFVDDFSESENRSKNIFKEVLANLRIRIQDSSLKILHAPGNGKSGVALEIKISNVEYFDEAGVNAESENSAEADKNCFEPQSYAFKKFIFEGVSLFTSEFSTQARGFSASTFPYAYVNPNAFVPGSPEMPPPHCSLPMKKSEEPEIQEEPILISKLTGQQELRLKLKQNESLIGPKVDVEFNLGAFNLFLIPKQVHLLYDLLSGLLQPSSTEDCRRMSVAAANKPMRAADFALVEQELYRQQQKCEIPTKSLKNQGWSSHCIDESDDEINFMSMESKHCKEFVENENDSLSSSISSDFVRSDSSGNQFSTNLRRRSRNSSTVQALLQDQVSELTHFHGCVSSCCIIILHDDSVQESLSASCKDSEESDTNKSISLKERAETFFDDLLKFQMDGFDFKDFNVSRDPLSKLCETNHLRLMASSVTIDGNEKSSSIQRILNFSMSFFKCEILESLFNSANIVNKPNQKSPTYVEILKCDNRISSENNTEMQQAALKLKYQQIDYIAENRTMKPPTNKLELQFGPITCEFDISITDRIQTLLGFQGSFSQNDSKKEDWKDSEIMATTRSAPKTDINLSSPNVTINLRFPIPDLRSIHDINRVPWWQQNLHKEILIMELKDVTFCTTLENDSSKAKYEVQCRDFHGLFQLSSESDPISFLRVSVDPEVDEASKEGGFDWPRLVIHKISGSSGGDLQTGFSEPEETYSYSLSEVLMSNLDTELSPFCATSVLYGSKLQKDSENQEEITNLSLEHEEVIKPADKETTNKFIDKIISKSEYFLEFSLPTVNLVLPSKDFFELIYNRLGNDLLLWQKTSIIPSAPYDLNGFKVHVPGLDLNSQMMMNDVFEKPQTFKSFHNDSDSDEDDANYCSVHEYWQRQKHKHRDEDSNHPFTALSISLVITKGMLTITSPILDNANKPLPDVCGKLQLYVEDSQIFVASSYKGDPNEGYICVLADKSILYHKAIDKICSKVPVVEPLSSSRNRFEQIIYQSEPGMRLNYYDNYSDMLKVVVHIVNNPKQLLKSFKVAIDISDATLRHYTYSVPEIWINQMIEFLKVDDFPVNGHVPSAVVTEFHLNLSNCSIDYRPLKLPLWSCITMENFNMSCNISATTPSFLFRIISEELRIFLSASITAKKIDLRKNYVCVVDTGLIDVSFRTTVNEKDEPKLELCASNNIIHIRTCSDSFKALLDLITYLSINGDMEPVEPEEEKAPKSYSSTPVDSKNLNLLVAEAMKDCSVDQASNMCNDRNRNSTQIDQYAMDDEFVILDDDPGLGLVPKNGDPQVRILTDEPITIIENHFSVPAGKSDVLKAPKHYPKPVVLLALRELSLVWHMYGGNDFKLNGKKRDKKNKKRQSSGINTVTFADEKSVNITSDNESVSFCKVTPMAQSYGDKTVLFSMEYLSLDQKTEPNLETWLQKGGQDRNHDILMELQMNKLQFQREVYPAEGEHASRYILLVHDIEIRDRLKSSDINKFLYQYSSQKIPRQSHANMIDVKALYIRPDPKRSSEECSLKISCKPLRLNVDQDALFFLIGFFRDIFEAASDDSSEGDSDGADAITKSTIQITAQAASSSRANSVPETFYRYFSFCPDVLIRIDYHGKHVQMEEGALKGFLLGLTQLNSSEIKLKRLCYRHGLLGHHKVLAYATNEWQQDILKHQLQNVLSGVGPMNSVVQLFQGIKDLFYLPVAQYQKDGQIVRGIQRGASSFSTSTAMAFLDLASRLVRAIQVSIANLFTLQNALIFISIY